MHDEDIGRPRSLTTTVGPASGLLAAAVVTAGLLAGCGSSGSAKHRAASTTSPFTTLATTAPTTTAPATTAAPPPPVSAAPSAPLIWPPPGQPPALDPLDAARRFATDYLGIPQPAVAGCGPTAPAAPPTCTATVQPRGQGPTTRVLLAGAPGGWQVASAQADDIKISTPAPGAPTGAAVRVEGVSTAFEGTIAAEVRAADWTPATRHVIAATTFSGGANGVVAPLRGTVPLADDAPKGPAVLVLTEPDASGGGAVIAATVIPIIIT